MVRINGKSGAALQCGMTSWAELAHLFPALIWPDTPAYVQVVVGKWPIQSGQPSRDTDRSATADIFSHAKCIINIYECTGGKVDCFACLSLHLNAFIITSQKSNKIASIFKIRVARKYGWAQQIMGLAAKSRAHTLTHIHPTHIAPNWISNTSPKTRSAPQSTNPCYASVASNCECVCVRVWPKLWCCYCNSSQHNLWTSSGASRNQLNKTRPLSGPLSDWPVNAVAGCAAFYCWWQNSCWFWNNNWTTTATQRPKLFLFLYP